MTVPRIALVSGGSRNLGRAFAEALARMPCIVYVTGRDASALQETVRRIDSLGGQAHYITAELTDPRSAQIAVNEVVEREGRVDVLVNSAAIRPAEPLSMITVQSWDEVIATNLRAPFLFAQAAAAHMARTGFGRIVNIAGVDAYWGTPNRCHVVASKAGLIGLSRALAAELADYNVTVNCVVLGFFETTRAQPIRGLRAEWRDARIRQCLLKRPGRLEEAASVVAFLASDASSYVTGQEIHVNGGGWPTVRGADSEHQAGGML